MVVDEKIRADSHNHSKNFLLFVLCAIVFSLPPTLFASQNNDGKSDVAVPRYRVFSLRHITAAQAEGFLKKASIQAESQTVKGNIISITALQQEMTKASEVLRLVDSEKPFEVETVVPTAAVSSLPTSKEISSKLGNIQIGSFAAPPAGQGDKAIIDISGGAVLIVAPLERIEQIELFFTSEQSSSAQNEPEDANEILAASLAKPSDEKAAAISDFNNQAESAAKNQDKIEINNPDLMDVTSLLKIKTNNVAVGGAEKIKKADANPPAGSGANPPATGQLSDVFSRLVDSLGKKDAADSNKAAAPTKPQAGGKVTTKASEEINLPAAGARETAKTSQTSEVEPVVDGNEVISVSLPEKISTIQLIGLVSEYLHLNYMYDATVVQGDITLKLENKLEGKLKVKDLYPLLESVMKQKGLVMTRRGNFVTIVQSKDVVSIDPALVDTTKGKIQKGDIVITRIFRLQYIDAESVKNLLTGMGLGLDINTSASTAGFIIVTEYAYRMDRIEELINIVDKPGEPKKFHLRQLKYTMASSLKDKIKALAEQLGTVSITIAQPAARAQPPMRPGVPRTIAPTPTPSTAPASESLNVFIDVDERTNRLLMIGREEQLDIVESLIDTLDVQQQDLRSLRLYQIQYADAQDVISKLEALGIIAAGRTRTQTRGTTTTRYTPERITPPGQPTTGPTGQTPSATTVETLTGEEPQVVVIESTNSLLVNATAEQHLRIATIIGYVDSEPEQASTNYAVYPLENQDPEDLAKVLNQLIQETVENKDPSGKVVGTTVTKKTEEEITIIPDKNTFSIIVYASKKNQQWVESLIRQLDRRRPQVLIDVTLVEVSKNDEFNLDLDIVTKYPSISKVGDKGYVGLISNTTDPANITTSIWDARSASGSGTAFYADNHIQALLTAMNTKNYGRVLAKPKLLVNDNETGKIATQVQTAIVSPLVTVIPGTANNSATSALSVSTQTYTSQIKLEIKPHISEGNLLRLEVTMNRTDFGDLKDYNLTVGENSLKGPIPPDLLSSDVTTVITVPDDRTIILGGLEKLKQNKGGTKVPILGDLPLVGGLFRKTANKDSQNRLYVFVKANILRPEGKGMESDIVRISDKNRQEFEKHEKEMQDYEDWPGIKPTPMDPKKVLDADSK